MHYRYMPALLALWACPVSAHVTANPDSGAAGSYFQTSFRISHGCEQSPTISVHVSIPDGILSVRPQAKPGWKVEIRKKKLPEPVQGGHGKMVEEVVTDIVWSGGKLSSEQYDEFGLLMKLPDKADNTLWFPVVQGCKQGENRWVEIPEGKEEWHSLAKPAPFVKILPNEQAHHH